VWGFDRDRIAVVGSGAGGHLAALVGLAAEAEPRVAAVCTVAAPTHLTSLGPEHDRPTSPASLLVGGPLGEFREAAQRASPLSYVSADDPPCLVIHGDRDDSIPAAQSVKFDAALRAAGVDSTLVVLEGAGHRPDLGRASPAGRALLEFLDRTLGPGVRASAAAP
jgi:dipeptidyl aminopeptidase/acylaminoacyl peptidase